MRIHWVIPTRVAPGSGGTRTIVQVATELADRGHDVTISVACEAYEPEEVQGVLCEHYGMHGARVVAIKDIPADCDLAVATEWRTAEPVKDLPAAHKAYFVQDFEPWFMPMGYDQIRARLSYTYGFSAVCIGRWLPHKLADEASVEAASFDFGVDTGVYRRCEGGKRGRAVCAVYQPAEKPRRCGPLLLEAMKIVHAIDPDVALYYFGSGVPGDKVDGYPGDVLGVLGVHECNELYNRCAVGVCLSASNPSRVPFEMMAAGLPVIDMHVPNNLYDAVPEAELLVQPTPEDLAGAVLMLLADEQRRESMGDAGALAMSQRPLKREAVQAAELLERVARGEGLTSAQAGRLYTEEPYRATKEVLSCARALRDAERRRVEQGPAVQVGQQTSESSGRGLLGRLLRR